LGFYGFTVRNDTFPARRIVIVAGAESSRDDFLPPLRAEQEKRLKRFRLWG